MSIFIDLFQLVCDYSNIYEQLNICQLNRNISENIYIHILNDNYKNKLSDCVLKQKKYKYLKVLKIPYNNKIYDINHLIYLVELDCSSEPKKINANYLEYKNRSSITDYNIKNLNRLKVLRSNSNENVGRDLSCFPNLEYFECYNSDCGVTDNSLINLPNLKTLKCSCNKNLTNINHLTSLTELDCSSTNIKNIDKLTNLEILDCAFNKQISDDVLINLKKLVSLNIMSTNIKHINHLTNLEFLNCSEQNYICNEDLIGLDKLVILYCSFNMNITNINHLTNLTELDYNYTKIPIEDIDKLPKLLFK